MLRNAAAIDGYTIMASDGQLGTVSEFLFDDSSWRVRWMIIDTGSWLFGRKVLLPPSVLGHIDPVGKQFQVRLTMQEVKDSPGIDTDLPVSRQMETHVYDYYGWSPYWGGGGYESMGGYAFPGGGGYIGGPAYPGPNASDADIKPTPADPHLRSTRAVTGYHIHASDGEIGHVEDFLLEDADWSIHYLVVDTKNWWPGKKVLISPRSVLSIDWMLRLIHLSVNREALKNSPEYDPEIPVDRAFEKQFHRYYGDLRLNS